MSGPILRPTRQGDFEALYDAPPSFTIWAQTAELEGRVVGIGGIAYIAGKPILFSRMADELRPYKKFILRCARIGASMAAKTNAAAIANPKEPLSCRLLARIGLNWKGTAEEGEVFAWRA